MNGTADRSRMWVALALLLGTILRIGILMNTNRLGTEIVDEQHYARLADNILAGNGFASGPDHPTSIRPPLYPTMVALVWKGLGGESLQAIRVVQVGFSLVTCGLVYLIGVRAYDARAGRIAAALFWVYPSFIFFDALILTETLFTLMLMAFVLASVSLVQTPRAWTALGCGVALGLAALTRSVLWPLPLLFCPLMALLIRAPLPRRIALPALVMVGYVVVVAPWAIRNTRLQGVFTVVDTMGGMNLRMGNYEYTPEDRMWDAVSLTGEKNWVNGIGVDLAGQRVTEGIKDKWAQRKAIAFMRDHPALTVRRSFIKFADFWGLEREFVAGVQQGLYTPPMWFQILGSVAIVLAYVGVVILGAAGVWLAAPEDWRVQAVLLLPVLVIMGAHTIVFGHSRYHLPLMPLLGIYAAALLTRNAPSPSYAFSHRFVRVGALVSVAALLAIWIHQVAFVDLARISSLLNHVG